MGKVPNKSKPGKGNSSKNHSSKGKQRADVRSIDKAKFKVKKGGDKDKRGRSLNFARSDYQKKVSFVLDNFIQQKSILL